MLCQSRSLWLAPLAGRAFLPGVSAQEQGGFAAGDKQCCWSPMLRKAEIFSGCRGENRFFAVLSILYPNCGLSWGLCLPSPGCTQPWQTFSRGFGQANDSPLPTLSVFPRPNTSRQQSRRIPLPGSAQRCCRCLSLCVVWEHLFVWQVWHGEGGHGGCTGLLQEGCNTTEQPGLPGYTLSCSYLRLTSVWISLSRSAASAEPQPGLFLADLFIWVLHRLRPRLSFCCTCASVHSPGSFRHMGGVSFYPRSPSGIDNCLTEDQRADGATGGVPAWGEPALGAGRKGWTETIRITNGGALNF